jgi:hypothetical protein
VVRGFVATSLPSWLGALSSSKSSCPDGAAVLIKCLASLHADSAPGGPGLPCPLQGRPRVRSTLQEASFLNVVTRAWQCLLGNACPFARLHWLLHNMAKCLKSWSDRMIGSIRL